MSKREREREREVCERERARERERGDDEGLVATAEEGLRAHPL